MRPEETRRPNPSQAPLSGHALWILIIVAAGIAASIAVAFLAGFLLSGVP